MGYTRFPLTSPALSLGERENGFAAEEPVIVLVTDRQLLESCVAPPQTQAEEFHLGRQGESRAEWRVAGTQAICYVMFVDLFSRLKKEKL